MANIVIFEMEIGIRRK